MKHTKLFASALLLTALATLSASCGDSSVTATAPEGTVSVTPTTETEAVTEDVLQPYHASADLGGQEFHILSVSHNNTLYFTDEQNGDVMNDAVYARTALTEEYLNVDITYDNTLDIHDVTSTLTKCVSAGDDAYQLVLTHVMSDVSSNVTANVLLDWNTVSTVDFSREYWNQSIVDELAMMDHVYYVRSEYVVPNPLVMYFNKTMVSNYDLDNPYDLVREGKWTLDRLITMASAVSSDVNGDGKMDKEDSYGFCSMLDWQLTGFLYAADARVCQHDGDSLVITLNNERVADLVTKVYDLTHAPYAFSFTYTTDIPVDITSDRVLFYPMNLSYMMTYRDSKTDIGILPYPKYEESQKTYHQYDLASLMCMPSSVQDTATAGTVVEMLSYYSMQTTIPAYYDVLLNSKLVRDEDSVEMLDIIFDNLVYDAGMNYFGLGTNYGYKMVYVIPQICQTKSADFASFYAKNEKGFQKEIDKFVDAVKSNG